MEKIKLSMRETIKNRIEKLLSEEYYCSSAKLNGKDIIYTINTNAQKPYIKILAYRNCIVVCTSRDLYIKVKEILKDKNRDEIFELPFVYGQTIHYVPDNTDTYNISNTSGYEYEFLFYEDILKLGGLKGFENSLSFDENGHTPTKAVYIAKDCEQIVGIAGAAKTSIEGVWEMGIDVREEYRNARVGTNLVSSLTKQLLLRNIVPFYSASVTNIGSQMVASRCGYIPLWVDTFGTILDGSSVYNINLIFQNWVI